MSTDDQKVGLIPVTLMVAGNIMGSGVFLLPANLASTGGIAIWGGAGHHYRRISTINGLCQNVISR